MNPALHHLPHLALAVALLAGSPAARAHDPLIEVPPHFELLTSTIKLDLPTTLAFAPDGALYVAEKNGRVRRVQNDVLQATPVLDLTAEVNGIGDRGLLGLALHPGFVPDGGPNSWIYLLYTVSPVLGQDLQYDHDGMYSHSRLTRYRVLAGGGGIVVALAPSRQILLGERLADGTSPDAIASLHNSHSNGAIRFAPDGTLLLSTGDGAHWDLIDQGGVDPEGFDDVIHPVTLLRGQLTREQDSGAYRSRDIRSLAGKVLRLDPETGLGLPSNPFFDGDPSSNRSRVYAVGLRNPYRLIHRPGTGQGDPAAGDVGELWIGDVGYSSFEELNRVDAPGLDFGWPCFEGPNPQPLYSHFQRPEPNPFAWPDCFDASAGTLRLPALAYHHSVAGVTWPGPVHVDHDGTPLGDLFGSCVVGGTFYSASAYPSPWQGRYFFADYSADWVKAAEVNGSGQVVEVRSFIDGIPAPVDVQTDPTSGELVILTLGQGPSGGRLSRLRYGANLTPDAVLQATPLSGPSPLAVQFDASASSDPEHDPLSYRFDFGDGSPLLEQTEPTAAHVYQSDGIYLAQVQVTDSLGLSSSDEVELDVGVDPPQVWIDSPSPALVIDLPATVALSGGGLDPAGGPLDYAWRVDLFHDDHIHPSFFAATTSGGASSHSSVDLSSHGDPGGVDYYRVVLRATTVAGTSAEAVVWVYPSGQFFDPAGSAELVARALELAPGLPSGSGHPDPEVIRDAVEPAAGTLDPLLQWTSDTGGLQAGDDWLGYTLPTAVAPESRFVAFEFREGLHLAAGGWFESLGVEVLDGGQWQPVSGLWIDPPYPTSPAASPPYERYTLHFDPQHGDGIRLRGVPGGSGQFVSCAELRTRLLTPGVDVSPFEDLTAAAELIARLDELDPPLPLGLGNPDRETLRNGTAPPAGSTSLHAQFDTSHNGDQGDFDWLGLRFPTPRTLVRVVFHEGATQADGGWFETVGVEYQAHDAAPWTPVPGVQITPVYRSVGPASPSYEPFVFQFPPLVASAVRLSGAPGGSTGYVSAAELRGFGPAYDPLACGFAAYGTQHPFNTIDLDSDTPPLLGHPGRISVSAAPPAAPGALVVALGSLNLPLGPSVLLVNPTGALLLPLFTDAEGRAGLDYLLPGNPLLGGQSLYLQAVCFEPSFPGGLRYSHGLAMTLCP
jgi:glucose/arabinose dehydrogenase